MRRLDPRAARRAAPAGLALALILAGEASAEWTVRAAATPGPGAASRCVVESPRQAMRDGYQDSWIQVIVDDKSVRVTSASELDAGDRDIGIAVDDGAFVTADEIVDRKTAIFTSHYRALVDGFKRGRRAQIQLRFWPTWPKTGTHAVAVSLIGFTHAHARMADCRNP